MFLTLSEVETRIVELAQKIGAGQGICPTYGYSEQTGCPHIEINVQGYHYVVAERGQESERHSTLDLDELLYWVFADMAFSMATSYELKNRIEDQDCRRIIFQGQLELLEMLSPQWAARQIQEQEKILKKYPFDDFSSVRASLCRELREQGNSAEEAWKMACEQYPLPAGSSW